MVDLSLAKIIGSVIIALGSMVFTLYAYNADETFRLISLLITGVISILAADNLMEW